MAKKVLTTWDGLAKRALLSVSGAWQWAWVYVKWCAGYPLLNPDGTYNELVRRGWNAYAKKDGCPDNTFEEWATRIIADRKQYGVNPYDIHCADCSGFVCYCLGLSSTDISTDGFKNMPQNPSLALGPAGSILCSARNSSGHTSHVGIDIGYGYSISIENWDWKRPKGYPCIMLNKISDYPLWETSHLYETKWTTVDYTGATNR